jgi:hypothetical protein
VIPHSTALLCYDVIHDTPDISPLLNKWTGGRRPRFMLYYAQTCPTGPFWPRGNYDFDTVFIQVQTAECTFFCSDIDAKLRRLRVDSLYFLGHDMTGIVETNVRAAVSLGFFATIVPVIPLAKHDESRLSQYAQYQSIKDMLTLAESWSVPQS